MSLLSFREFCETNKINESKKSENILDEFINNENTIIYLSPGPMTIKGNVEYSIYIKDGIIKVPSDNDIKDAQDKDKEYFKNLAWFTPLGYHFGIKHDQNTQSNYIIGRPNNAVGKSLLLSREPGGIDSFYKLVDKYNNTKAIRSYLKNLNGNKANYL